MMLEGAQVAGRTVTVPAESEGPIPFDFQLTWMDITLPARRASVCIPDINPSPVGNKTGFPVSFRKLARLRDLPRPGKRARIAAGSLLLLCVSFACTVWTLEWQGQARGNSTQPPPPVPVDAPKQPDPARSAGTRPEIAPRPLRIVPARYTAEARYARFRGKIFAVVTVDAQGRAQNLEFTAPIPFSLDLPAWQAARKWRFRPAMRGGNAVERRTLMEVPFR